MNIAETSGAGRASATPLIRRGVVGCGAAVALAGAVYLNALDNPFIYDDYRLVALNQSLRDLSNLRAVFWHEVTRPLVNLSYAIDRAIWGPERVRVSPYERAAAHDQCGARGRAGVEDGDRLAANPAAQVGSGRTWLRWSLPCSSPCIP